MIAQAAALVFATLCAGVILFHLAAASGARVGPYTQGGRHPGALPVANRVIALVSAGLTAAVALAVLGAVGIGPDWPGWTLWGALGFSGLALAANLATPSRPERRVWAPVAGAMLASVGLVALGTG